MYVIYAEETIIVVALKRVISVLLRTKLQNQTLLTDRLYQNNLQQDKLECNDVLCTNEYQLSPSRRMLAIRRVKKSKSDVSKKIKEKNNNFKTHCKSRLYKRTTKSFWSSQYAFKVLQISS